MIHHNSIQFDGFAHYSISSLEFVSERLKRRIKSTSLYQSLRHQFHIAPPPIKRPIFIVGTIRSGKTILAKCLGNHPRIVYLGYELTTEWCDFANIEIARSNANKTQCPPYGESDATEAGCRHVRHGFAELHVQKGGSRGTRLLDENPHLWNKLPFLVRIFPDANLLITGRDIRSTVASMKVLWIEQHKNNGKKYYFPRDTEYCWTAIPPARPDEMDASRIFPGGDLVVLAEYWLHTYEMIEKTIDGVNPPVLVEHREFLKQPHDTLSLVFDAIGIPSYRYGLPVNLDLSRNEGWRQVLTAEEQDRLQGFIELNRSRIERLKYTDTTLCLNV